MAAADELPEVARALMLEVARATDSRPNAESRAFVADALAILVARWSWLRPDVRGVVGLFEGASIDAAVARACASEDAKDREHALLAALELGRPGTATRAAEMLADPERGVRTAAEGVLLGLVRGGSKALDVDDALTLAVRGFGTHRADAVIDAALEQLASARAERGALSPSTRALWEAITDTTGPAWSAAAGRLRRRADAMGRSMAWRWLGTPALARAAEDRLSRRCSAQEHSAVLAEWHLALHPARGARVVLPPTKRGAACAMPDAAKLGTLSEEARVGVFRLADAIGMPAPALGALCMAAARDVSERVRLAAASVAPLAHIAEFTLDACPAVARRACVRVSEVGEAIGSSRVKVPWRALARSAHAEVARMARDEVRRSRVDFDGTGLESVAARVAARAVMAEDPASVLSAWRAEWASGGADRRALIGWAGVLSIETPLAEELLGALQDEDARTRASAASALSRVQKFGDARDALVRAVEADDDARVRANAIEALARLARRDEVAGDRLAAMTLELKGDEHHRVRSSAVWSMLTGAGSTRARVAATELVSMLADDREMHRVAGLWLAERTVCGRGALVSHAGEVRRVVEDRLSGDASAWVRRRASALAERLGAEAVEDHAMEAA